MRRSRSLNLGGAAVLVSRVAAIDCGTNSIRLLIADVTRNNSQNSFREVVREMEIVKLGEGVDTTQKLSEAAVARTLSALEKFTIEIRRKGVERLRFCATSAVRDAQNRNIFLEPVKELLGLEPEVISGEEEARLSFLGATHELHDSAAPILVVDIGGGSTEFVYGESEVKSAKSVNIGCVRMAERHLSQNPVEPGALARAILDIDNAIEIAASQVPIRSARTVVAVAGTATTVAAAALGLDSYDRYAIHLSEISAESVERVASDLQRSSRDEIASLGFMHPGRVDVITAGALILDRVMKATGAGSFLASERDILDGIAFSIAE